MPCIGYRALNRRKQQPGSPDNNRKREKGTHRNSAHRFPRVLHRFIVCLSLCRSVGGSVRLERGTLLSFSGAHINTSTQPTTTAGTHRPTQIPAGPQLHTLAGWPVWWRVTHAGPHTRTLAGWPYRRVHTSLCLAPHASTRGPHKPKPVHMRLMGPCR